MADFPDNEQMRLIKRRLTKLEREQQQIKSAVNAHADFLRSIGALSTVLGASVPDPATVEQALDKRQEPPHADDR